MLTMRDMMYNMTDDYDVNYFVYDCDNDVEYELEDDFYNEYCDKEIDSYDLYIKDGKVKMCFNFSDL